jgi:hypothetical protein
MSLIILILYFFILIFSIYVLSVLLAIYVSSKIFAGKYVNIKKEYNLHKKIHKNGKLLNIPGKINKKNINTRAYFFDNSSNTCMLFFNGNGKNIQLNLDTELYFLNKCNYDILCYNYLGYYGSSPSCKSSTDLYEQGKIITDYLLKENKYKNIILYGNSFGGIILPVVADYISKKYIDVKQQVIILNSYYNLNNVYPYKTKHLIKAVTPWNFDYAYKCLKNLINNNKINKYFFNSIYEYYNFKNTIAYYILNKNNIELSELNKINEIYLKNKNKFSYEDITDLDNHSKLINNYKIADNLYIYLINGLHGIQPGAHNNFILDKIYNNFLLNKLSNALKH